MSIRLSRRRRQIAWTLGSGLLLLIALGALALQRLRSPDETYRPGEAVEGLTNTLRRDLPPTAPILPFEDVASRAGLAFHHFPGTRSTQLPEDMGSGAAWGDYDGDGDLDLYVANISGPLTVSLEDTPAAATSRLYRNNGDGTFTDVSEAAGVALRCRCMAPVWLDADRDGDLDLFVTAYGTNHFFRNEGGGAFTERTDAAGLRAPEGFWAGAAVGDYDADGHLDLYVTGYVRYRPLPGASPSRQYDVDTPAALNPSSFEPERNLLYHNRGDGTFEEVALTAGVANPEGRSLAAVWADFDDDGDLDLYVANDVSDNALFRNRGDGTFDDVSHPALVADYRGAMGLAVGDWDADTDLDLFVTHWIAQENALYVNRLRQLPAGRARLLFMDQADRFGLGQVALDFIGWGTSFFDADNDGRLDLLVVNGSTFQQPDDPTRLIPMRDQLFWNGGPEEGFFDLGGRAGAYFDEAHIGRGAAFADYDEDGDVDVFIVNHGEAGALLRNPGTPGRHWLAVSLRGRRSNTMGLGARLRLVAGGTVQVRQTGAQASYLSQNAPIAYFGLGEADRVDTLEVRWPSGIVQRLTGLPADQHLTLTEPDTP
ncbi:MAG: RNA-binding protein [Rhodothermaceae bacterium]|nr:MAG: RNA-binding protein [Rhodothermaceae bacterium]